MAQHAQPVDPYSIIPQALNSLSRSIQTLNSTSVQVPRAEFRSPAALAFAELALDNYANFSDLMLRLGEHYSHPRGGDGRAGNQPRIALAGTWGIALVERVLRRFTQFGNQKEAQHFLGWVSHLDQLAKLEFNEYAAAARNQNFQQPEFNPIQIQTRSSTSFSTNSPSTANFSPSSVNTNPTESTTSQQNQSYDRTGKGFFPGHIVWAQLKPDDKTSRVPAMIFEDQFAPKSGVGGHRREKSSLVAVLGAKHVWHWIPPSRLQRFPVEKLAAMKTEAEREIAKFGAEMKKFESSAFPNEAKKLEAIEKTLGFMNSAKILLNGLNLVTDESAKLNWVNEMKTGVSNHSQQATTSSDQSTNISAATVQPDRQETNSISSAENQEIKASDLPLAAGHDNHNENVRTAQTELFKEMPSMKKQRIENEPIVETGVNASDYCYCKREIPGQEWLGCENPDCPIKWFHPSCVDYTGTLGANDKWYCAECRA